MHIRSTNRPRPSHREPWTLACGLLALCAVLACGRSEVVPTADPDEVGRPVDASQEQGPQVGPTVPESRGGRDLIGKDARQILPAAWLADLAPPAGTGEAQALLVRWWTVNCPHCRVSLPAIELLRGEFESRGLATLGVFHPKPPRAVTVPEARESAHDLGYGGPVAVDPEWEVLRELWLDGPERSATSASFLIDAQGTIRFVHPGPQFQATDHPVYAADRADFDALHAAIDALVQE